MTNSTRRFGHRQSEQARVLVAVAITAMLLVSGPMMSVQATAGDLDPSFGAGGKVTTDFFGSTDAANAIAIQGDGKVVAAGTASTFFGLKFALARYNTDGSLDPSFGAGGKLTTDFFGSAINEAHAVVIQSDGKIVAAGDSESVNSGFEFALARYNADGSLDSSFGSGGKVTTVFSGGTDEAVAVAIQADGRIVAAGFADGGIAGNNFALARYNTDGSLDPSFGTGGKVTTDFFGSTDIANAIAIQSGKIVLAGFAFNAGASFDFALARYNTDGSLDPSFGAGGKVTTDFFFGSTADEAAAMAIQSDGKIVVAGTVFNTSILFNYALARYQTDGSLDPSFGSGGKVTTDFFGGTDKATAVAIQADGKIVAAGIIDSDFAVARYNTNGSLDPGFGAGGKVTTDFFGEFDQAFAVAIQSDDKIVAAGEAFNSSTSADFALARYNGASFDVCLQDDSSGYLLQFTSTTGNYLFTNCAGGTLTGTGSITTRGSIITLQQFGPDRRVLARIDRGVNTGTATIQLFSSGTSFGIIDRNTANDTCACR